MKLARQRSASAGMGSPSRLGRIWPWAALVVIGVTGYANSLTGPFVFDDVASIAQNPSILHLWPLTAVLHPPPAAGVGGRPLLNLSFALNHSAGGFAVPGFHLVNLLIHLLAASLLFAILRRVWEVRLGEGPGIPLGIAILWEIHPLQTSAVTYLSQRAESLMGLFYLVCLYALIRGVQAKRGSLWFGLGVIAMFAGIGTKEVMVTAPVVAFLFDRVFLAGSFAESWRRRWGFYLGLASSWLILPVLTTGLNQRGVGWIHGVTPARYLATEGEVVLRYLKLVLWPSPLILDYGTWFATNPERYLACGLATLSLLTFALVSFRAKPDLGFLGCAFFLLLAPTSSVVPIAAAPMAENRMYLPSAAILIFVGLGLRRWLGERAWIAFGVLSLACLMLTLGRNEEYRTDLGLWAVTVRRRPENARARYEYGNALVKAGDFSAAISEYTAASRLSPDLVEAQTGLAEAEYDLGNALRQTGRLDEAQMAYEAALRLRPGFAEALMNLGAQELASGQFQRAVSHLRAVVQLRPDDADARYDLQLAEKQMSRH